MGASAGKVGGLHEAQADLVVHSAPGQSWDELGCVVDVLDQALNGHQEATVCAHLQGWVEDQPVFIQLHVYFKQRGDALLKGTVGSANALPSAGPFSMPRWSFYSPSKVQG